MRWSMLSAGFSVPAPLMMRAGTPTAVLRGGMDSVTATGCDLGIGSDLDIADDLGFCADQDAGSDLGAPIGFIVPVPPSVTPCRIETLSSITTVSPACCVVEEDAFADLRARMDVGLENLG